MVIVAQARVEGDLVGRNGQRLKPQVLNKLVAVMCDPVFDGANQKVLGAAVGVSARTVRNYLTPAVWAQVKARRLEVVQMELEAVDRAIYQKAVGGSVAAAKLIYGRWEMLRREEAGAGAAPLSLPELEAELERVQGEILALEGGKNV